VPGKAPSCAGAKLEAAAPSPLVGGVLRATKLDRGLISKFQNASLSLSLLVTCGNIFTGEILHLRSFDMRASLSLLYVYLLVALFKVTLFGATSKGNSLL
jgi:hypothetical protein